jgi:hypothetical protein
MAPASSAPSTSAAQSRAAMPETGAMSPPPRVDPVPVSSATTTAEAGSAADETDSEQVRAIKAAVQGQKFLWSMAGAATRWEVEGGELRLYFPVESRALAEMLQARDPMERLRTVLNRAIGEPLRVCVKVEGSRPAAARGSDLQARFQEDPMVRAMLERFGGQISKVKRPGEE